MTGTVIIPTQRKIIKIFMEKLLYIVLGSILILVSCCARGQKPEHSQNGRPEDKYACTINSAGYCIFTGTPHTTGLKSGTNNLLMKEWKNRYYFFSK